MNRWKAITCALVVLLQGCAGYEIVKREPPEPPRYDRYRPYYTPPTGSVRPLAQSAPVAEAPVGAFRYTDRRLEERVGELSRQLDLATTRIRELERQLGMSVEAARVQQEENARLLTLVQERGATIAPPLELTPEPEPPVQPARVAAASLGFEARINSRPVIEPVAMAKEAEPVAVPEHEVRVIESKPPAGPVALPPAKEIDRDGTVRESAETPKPPPGLKAVYDVVYVFEDKTSCKRFFDLLTAYGVNDKFWFLKKKEGEYVISVGRFSTPSRADDRRQELNAMIESTNLQVLERWI